jgi:hypothetical protein
MGKVSTMASSTDNFLITLSIDSKNYDRGCTKMKGIFDYQDMRKIIMNRLVKLRSNVIDTQAEIQITYDPTNFKKSARVACSRK